MEGVVSTPVGAKSGPSDWIRRHPGVVPFVLAVLIGLVAFPAIANALSGHDVEINGRISLIHAVWLAIAAVLCIALIAARSSLRRDLRDGVRRLLAGADSAGGQATRSRTTRVDIPALGEAIVGGTFDLVLLLIVQGILRDPLVDVVSVYAPKAMVDGVFVVLVAVIALLMLFGLHRASQPLTEYLVTTGLDHLVPTAGFAAASLPDAPPTRTMTRQPSVASRGAGEATVAAGSGRAGADAPTIAEAATMAGSAEATVAAVESAPAWSSEATVAESPAPAESAGAAPEAMATQFQGAEATVLETPLTPPAPGPVPAEEPKPVAEPEASPGAPATSSEPAPAVISADATIVEAPGEREPSPEIDRSTSAADATMMPEPASEPTPPASTDAGDRTIVGDETIHREAGSVSAPGADGSNADKRVENAQHRTDGHS